MNAALLPVVAGAAYSAFEDKPSPVLSVLLCTVENRAATFALLHAEILRQCEGKPVEVLVACDAKQISIGKKRQNLIEQAKGEWVVFVDDDDWVSPDYVEKIMEALSKNPDYVGFLITCTTNGKNERRAITSMKYRQWGEGVDGYAHTRSPYHKGPTRRSIALKVGFPDLRYGEDRPYSSGITALIKTEVFIHSVLYFYLFKNEPFAIKYGITENKSPVARKRTSPPSPRYDFKGRRVG